MFLSITINNILVSFRVFIMGLFAGIGSAIMLIYNGIMLGTFQYFFIERGLTWISFITIWQHGIIEISSIVIAGGAGIVMGKGLMFPGSYSRSVSLRKSASKAISIITGLIPLFIIAGFIESFVTRQTELPDFIKILSLLLSASLILGYFYYYPRKVAKMTYSGLSDIDEITINDKPVDLNKSYSGIQTVNNVLRFAKINFESIISLSFFLAVVYGVVGIILYLTGSIPLTTNSLLSAHDYNKFPSYIITSVFIYTILFSRLYFLIKVKCISDLQVEKRFWTFFKKHWLKLFVISSLLNTPLFIQSGWGDLLYLTNIIIFTPSAISVMNGKRSLYKDVVSGFKLIFNHFGRYLTPVLILILLFIASYGCIMALDSFFKSTSGWGLEGFSVFVPAGKIFLEFFIDEIFTLIFSSLLFTSLVFGWHSINEIDNASDLIRRIENISTVKKYKFEK